MSDNSLAIRGAVKLDGFPDNDCITSPKELLQFLVDHLTLEVPQTITNVIVSNIQPTSAQRDSVWFRQSNGGQFLGIYVFADGTWKQIFPSPNGVTWFYGDSRQIPDGYLLITDSPLTPGISANVINYQKTLYLRDPTDTFYEYYAGIFIGL